MVFLQGLGPGTPAWISLWLFFLFPRGLGQVTNPNGSGRTLGCGDPQILGQVKETVHALEE